jgi:hypothetical protein
MFSQFIKVSVFLLAQNNMLIYECLEDYLKFDILIIAEIGL